MSLVWFNGALVEGPIPVDPADRGLTLGDGLFETIAIFNGKPVYLEAHLDRLDSGAREIGIRTSRAAVERGITELLRMSSADHAILRVTVTRGASARGLSAESDRPASLITLAPWQSGTVYTPARLATGSIRRNESSPASRLKSLSYIDNILAAREASRAGADDALLLNMQGRVACSTIANVFLIAGESLVTPPLSEGALPGITRARVLALARAAGLVADERPIAPADLFTSEAVLLTNSIRLIRPVIAIDGQTLPKPGLDRIRSIFDLLMADITGSIGALDPVTL
ncbi:MAG: aminotransferase class IV [Hyphomicrobiales bacterium]